MEQMQIDVLRHINRIALLHRLRVQNMLGRARIWGSQIPILLHVEQHPGCTQRDIARQLEVSSPSIATSIKRLQKAGMLEKHTDKADMRCNRIELTQLGRDTITQGRACYVQVLEQMLRGVSPGELQAMTALLAHLEENLAGDEYRDKTVLSLVAEADRPVKLEREESERP